MFFESTKYEFIFESPPSDKNPFTNLNIIFRAYESTKDYRNVKIRSNITKGGSLNLLDKESILNQYSNIWNLAKDDGMLGKFIFTNIRVV